MIKSICVFGGTAEGLDRAYLESAKQIGKLLAQKNIKIIFGGGSTGIMGVLAKSALSHNGQVVGIIPDSMREREDTLSSVTQLIIADSMHDRKIQMYDLAEAFLVLPGGMGTIDEAAEVLCWLNLGLHNKKVIIANIKDYWSSFFQTIKHGVDHEFINSSLLDSIYLIASVDELLSILNTLSLHEIAQVQESVSEKMKIMLKASNNPIDACVKIQELAAINGFKWNKLEQAIKKVTEEMQELHEQVLLGNNKNVLEEFGDLLFAVMNLSVHLDINYKESIKITNKKFLQRYSKMENLILQQKLNFNDLKLNSLLEFWKQVKNLETTN